MTNKKILSDKNKVYESYNQIGNWFDQHRSKDLSFEKHILDKVINYLPANGKVLDIGCGSGRRPFGYRDIPRQGKISALLDRFHFLIL